MNRRRIVLDFTSIAGGPKTLIDTTLTRNEDLPDAGILVSTHREATARAADKVVWLEAGSIKKIGAHTDLLSEDAEYQLLFAKDE